MAGQSTRWVTTARVLRRAGFGVTGPEVDAAVSQDWPAYVDAMLGADPDADPGAVATPINTSTLQNPELLQKLNNAIPLGRLAQPEEIATIVAFLAGPGASYLTATTLFADGGIMQSSPGL